MKILLQSDINERLKAAQSKQAIGETVRFGLVGVSNTAIDFAVFMLLTALWEWHVIAAQTVSYLIGLLNSYVWNRKITFKTETKSGKGEIIRFVIINVISYIVSVVLLSVLGDFSISQMICKLIVIAATFAVNFIGSKWWVFQRNK